MGLDIESPDHTTKSRRGQGLALDLRAVLHQGPIHLLIDSSGLAAFGDGEWAAAKHGAYDTAAIDEAAAERGTRVVVPPSTAATASRKPRARASPRNRTIKHVQEIERRAWKKEAGYHQQARVDNAFFRHKTIIGDRLRARSEPGRKGEARIACDVLNRMTELGRPESVAIRG